MRIWHRRSLKPDLNENRIVTKRICVEEQEDEDYGDDGEDICSSGRYFPNLLKSDEDYEQERSRNRRPKKNLNNSWPPASRFSILLGTNDQLILLKTVIPRSTGHKSLFQYCIIS